MAVLEKKPLQRQFCLVLRTEFHNETASTPFSSPLASQWLPNFGLFLFDLLGQFAEPPQKTPAHWRRSETTNTGVDWW